MHAILREPFRGHVRLNNVIKCARTTRPHHTTEVHRLLRARGVIHTCVDVLLRARIERLHRERKNTSRASSGQPMAGMGGLQSTAAHPLPLG